MDRKIRRVVVTGLGLVTPLGVGTEETWQGIIHGKSGVGLITRFDTTELPTRIAADVKWWRLRRDSPTPRPTPVSSAIYGSF